MCFYRFSYLTNYISLTYIDKELLSFEAERYRKLRPSANHAIIHFFHFKENPEKWNCMTPKTAKFP